MPDSNVNWVIPEIGVGNPANPGSYGGQTSNGPNYGGLPSVGAPNGLRYNDSTGNGGSSTLGDIAKYASIGIPLLSQLFHMGTTPTQTASTPQDLLQMRHQQIGLLQYLLGFGPDPRLSTTSHAMTAPMTAPWARPHTYAGGGMVSGPGTSTSDSIPAQLSNGEGVLTAQTVQALGGPHIIHLLNHLGRQHFADGGVAGFDQNAINADPQGFARMQQQAAQAGWQNGRPVTPQARQAAGLGIGGTTPYTGDPGVISAPPGVSINPKPLPGTTPGNTPGSIQTPQQRLESFYGPLGVTQSPLQNQGSNAFSQFLNQPSPWDRAANVTGPQLQQNMAGNPSTQESVNRLMGLNTGPGQNVSQGLSGIAGNPGGSGGFTGSQSMNQVLQNLGTGTTGAQQNLSQLGQGPSTGDSSLQQALQRIGMGGGVNQFAGLGQVNAGAGINPDAYAALKQLSMTNPGQGVVDSLHPLFEQNLAQADQVGGRFGTSNALGRQNATNQFNSTAANALQTGATQQQQAASSLGQLGSSADQTNMQGAIAGAGNQLQGALGGGSQQINALGLAQQGNLGQGNLALGANSTIGSQQLGATGQSIGAQQGLNSNVLQALSQLGGFNTQANAQEGQNATAAGNLGLGQGNLSNNAVGLYQQGANNQGLGNLNTVNSAFNAGVTNTQQGYQGQQNVMNILQSLLGAGQSASLGGPTVSTPGTGTQIASTLAQILPLLFNNNNGGGSGYYNPVGSIPNETPNGYGVG